MAGNSYVQEVVQAARRLASSNAFEPATGKEVESFRTAHKTRKMSKRSIRITLLGGALLTALLCLMSLCLPYHGVNTTGSSGVIYSPQDTLDCYALWFQINVMPLFDTTLQSRTGLMLAQFEEAHPTIIYQLIIQRGAVTLVVIACGILLAVSGMLFQTAFRNPLATPTMLGVSDGVTLGCIIFAYQGYMSAADNMGLYLMLVYGFGALAVVVVLLLSRVMSGKNFSSIFDMLLLGTVLCQLLGGVNAYITNFGMDSETWERFYNLQQAGDVLNYPQTWVVVAVVFVACIIPVVALRFRFNLISFNDDEGKLMGARPVLLRAGALVLGSVMQLAAIASIGQVAMLSLAVPFLVRYLMPSDFRYQLLGNVILGTIVLLVCIAVQHFAVIGSVVVPVGTLVSVLVVPFFVWAVALQSNKWGD